MGTEQVIAALASKRASLGTELLELEAKAAAIRADQTALDAAIRVFDPECRPAATATPRGNGISRAVLGVVRTADAPLTVREIATRLAPQNGASEPAGPAFEALVHNVRNIVARYAGKGLHREQRDGTIYWRSE